MITIALLWNILVFIHSLLICAPDFMLSLWLSLQQYSTWFFRRGQRKRQNCLINNAFIEHSQTLCMYMCVGVMCVFCCFVDSEPADGLLFFLDFLPSIRLVVSQFVCLWNSFIPYPQKSTSMTSKCMRVCLWGTHSGGVVSWSQPILCMRSQDKSIHFAPNVIYKYKKLAPWLNDLKALWGEEMGKVSRQFQVEPVWFLFAAASDHGWGFCFLCSEVSQLPWWTPRWMR